MELFVIGLIAGILLTYLASRLKRDGVPSAAETRPGAPGNGPEGPPPPAAPPHAPPPPTPPFTAVANWFRAAIPGVLIAVLAIVLVTSLVHEAGRYWVEESLLERFRMLMMRGIAPLGFGLAGGAVLFLVGQRIGAAATGTPTGTELGGLATLFVVVLLVLADPSFRWMRNGLDSLRSAKFGSVELSFGDVPRGTQESVSSGMGTFGSSRIERVRQATSTLSSMEDLITRDLNYLRANPVFGTVADVLDRDQTFIRMVVAPTIKALGDIEPPSERKSLFPLGGRRFATTLLQLTLPDDAKVSHRDRLRHFRSAFEAEWQAICAEHDHVGKGSPEPDGSPVTRCRVAWSTARSTIDAFLQDEEGPRPMPFAAKHVYGRLVASLVLYLIDEPHAAARALDDFVTDQYRTFKTVLKARDLSARLNPPQTTWPDYFPYELYRALYYQMFVLQDEVRDPEGSYRLQSILSRSIEVGNVLVESGAWAGQLEKVEKHTADASMAGMRCIEETTNDFRRFFASLLGRHNDLAYALADRRLATEAGLRTARQHIDRATKIDPRCLFADEENRLVYMIAVQDTRAAVYAASTDPGTQTSRTAADRACEAHHSATRARDGLSHLTQIKSRDEPTQTRNLLDIDEAAGRDREREILVRRRFEQTRQLVQRFADDRC